MRRKDREVTERREIESIIEKAKVVHVGMIDGNAPYVVALQYGYVFNDGALTLYLHGAKEGRKIDIIKKNPNVFIELETDIVQISGGDIPCKYSSAYASVMGEGRAEIVEDVNEKIFGLERIMKTQTGRDFTVSEPMTESVCVIKIVVPHVTAKSRPSASAKMPAREDAASEKNGGSVGSTEAKFRENDADGERTETKRSEAADAKLLKNKARDPRRTMYVLIFNQNGSETPVALFEDIGEARKSLRAVPGYTADEEGGDAFDVRETLSVGKLPDYTEIEYKGKRIPLSRFMFPDSADAEIFWREIPDMEKDYRGLVPGQTRVDAYVVDNEEAKAYIEKRERTYGRAKAILERLGYESDRAFFGSEDGEAIVYKKKDERDWHFLMHMDPLFVDGAPESDSDLEALLKENMS